MNPIELRLPPGATASGSLYPEMELDDLTQDILAVELPNGYIVDVGWFPEHDPGGRYVIRVFWRYWDEQKLTDPIRTRRVTEVVRAVQELAERYSRAQVSVSRSASARLASVTW